MNLGATTVWERRDSVQPDGHIGSTDMKYLSAAGPYEIHWQVKPDGDFALQVCIPFGAEAEIVLPNSAAAPIADLTDAQMAALDERLKTL